MASLTITKYNVDRYRNGLFPDVTNITWTIQDELYGDVLKCFPNLTCFSCNNNRLTSLQGIDSCTSLQTLYCGYNQLTSLQGIESCTALRILDCDNNQLTSLQGIESCIALQILYCYNNQLTSLQGIESCTALQILCCNGNRLISLQGIESCTALRELICSSNRLTSLQNIVYLHHLRGIFYSGNLIENPSIQVQRFLQRLRNVKQKTTVYEDSQNVHDITIQASTKNSLANLMNDSSIDFDITTILQSGLSEYSKNAITEYCSELTFHSYFLVTYQELFARVWNRIASSDHQAELIKILDEQIQDAECKCMTGRFVRTMSVLVGFYDDIVIGISDNAQIAAVVETVRKSIIPYDAQRHADVVYRQLIGMGYEESFIRPWIEAILEDI